ncbi:hypothetical protein ACJX0J_022759, partial [Zea mays]
FLFFLAICCISLYRREIDTNLYMLTIVSLAQHDTSDYLFHKASLLNNPSSKINMFLKLHKISHNNLIGATK